MKLKIIATIFAATFSSYCHADLANQLSKYVGYKIIAVKTIVKWRDTNNSIPQLPGQSHDAFVGCNFGRVIVFDDNTYLKCSGYGYQYSYRPRAVILSNGYSYKIIVDSSDYDMSLN